MVILLERGGWCAVQPHGGLQLHLKGRVTYGRQYIWTELECTRTRWTQTHEMTQIISGMTMHDGLQNKVHEFMV